jgi:hypothetical protein
LTGLGRKTEELRKPLRLPTKASYRFPTQNAQPLCFALATQGRALRFAPRSTAGTLRQLLIRSFHSVIRSCFSDAFAWGAGGECLLRCAYSAPAVAPHSRQFHCDFNPCSQCSFSNYISAIDKTIFLLLRVLPACNNSI